MEKLNKDVIHLILRELYDKKTLNSCLLVSRSWSEIIIPVLWKDPWKHLNKGNEKLLLRVIISHLPDKSRNKFSQGADFLASSHKRPLFNYISFCRHLNLNELKVVISQMNELVPGFLLLDTIKNEIFGLFINENTIITHLYMSLNLDDKIYNISGAERCLSKLEFLSCDSSVNENVFIGLAEICKSIKSLEFSVTTCNNDGIIKLIEAQRNLNSVQFQLKEHDSFYVTLENSLIKHADTIQNFMTTKQPVTNLLSSFVNLRKLELESYNFVNWNNLENVPLPSLQILNTVRVPARNLTNLIENTSGLLTKIKIRSKSQDDQVNKRLIKAIHQNCPNLRYLALLIRNSNILELEMLLINCQYLDGLRVYYSNARDIFDWDNFFKILIRSSPATLYTFVFDYHKRHMSMESLKLFFDGWRGRHPMLLQTHPWNNYCMPAKKYKAEGVIKLYANNLDVSEWF